MKKLISAILILLLCLGIYSCGKKDSASTASNATTPEVIIYPLSYGSTYTGLGSGDLSPNYCYGTNSSGYTEAPFYSTSTHDLKDQLLQVNGLIPYIVVKDTKFQHLGKIYGMAT